MPRIEKLQLISGWDDITNVRILFIFFVSIISISVASAAEFSKFPLVCGIYEIGGIADIQVGANAHTEMSLTLADGTLSETRLRLRLNEKQSHSLHGKFWIQAKIQINKRTTLYLLDGTIIDDPKLLSVQAAQPLRSFALLEKESPCEAP